MCDGVNGIWNGEPLPIIRNIIRNRTNFNMLGRFLLSGLPATVVEQESLVAVERVLLLVVDRRRQRTHLGIPFGLADAGITSEGARRWRGLRLRQVRDRDCGGAACCY